MTTDVQEGARAFTHVLHELEDGLLHAELSALVRSTCEQLSAHAEAYGKASGSLTLTLRFSTERGGPVSIDAEVVNKTPKIARPKSIMWLTPGGNLTPHNPRQQRLPLHEVSAPTAARDVAVTPRPTRSV
jgi:hypothetical protein